MIGGVWVSLSGELRGLMTAMLVLVVLNHQVKRVSDIIKPCPP
jgi:hypothetical protein